VYSLTSLCLLSHHPFVSNFRTCLHILRRMVDLAQDNADAKARDSAKAKAASTGSNAKQRRNKINLW
jgi:hypothetical protein